ncbi:uncharacterized protein C16orf78 homolog isoform X2 [Ranitomeya variabilis]|uniref:uncharacterized protein C16orf78 homolog isoform X2 n=1 Tax=Ranitomeya variabilis TaxID=490064 RepID=UPI004056D33A
MEAEDGAHCAKGNKKPMEAVVGQVSSEVKKLSHCLEFMKSYNDNLLKREERKIKKNLTKLVDSSNVSNVGLYKNIYKKPSSVALFENQQEDGKSTTLSSDHLLKIFSDLYQPVRNKTDKMINKESDMSLSGLDISSDMDTSRPAHGITSKSSTLLKSSNLHTRRSTLRWLAPELSQISIQERDVMLPLLRKLSVDKFQCHSSATDLALKTRLEELIFKVWQDKCKKHLNSYITPDEALRCRYLRLTEKNISSLLQKCKESGIHVDIHPHMKESDIDISMIMSSENINTVSL